MTERTPDDSYSRMLADVDAEALANAMAVAASVYSGVGLADRLRGSLGVTIAIETAAEQPDGEVLVGRLTDVVGDAVALLDPSAQSLWVVLLSAMRTARGLTAGHRPPPLRPTQARRTVAGLLRPVIGCSVTVALPERRMRGRLVRVGADHAELLADDASVLVPFQAVCWVRTPLIDVDAGSLAGRSPG